MPITETQVRAYIDPEEPNYQAAAAALGTEALPVLQRLVEGDDPLTASKAAYLASLIPGEESVRVLERAARSAHPTVRVAAAAGLQRRLDVPDDVTTALTRDPDEGVRQVAGKAVRARSAQASRSRKGETAAGGAAGEGGGSEGASAGAAGEPRAAWGAEETPRGESAAGMGGGELGGGESRSLSRGAGGEGEEDGGGGGDLSGGGSTRAAGSVDGPDGGGSMGNGGAGDRASNRSIAEHGGGRV